MALLERDLPGRVVKTNLLAEIPIGRASAYERFPSIPEYVAARFERASSRVAEVAHGPSFRRTHCNILA